MERAVTGAVSHLHHTAGSEMNMELFVGASLLAKNDDAVCLTHRGVCFASRLAPTGVLGGGMNHG